MEYPVAEHDLWSPFCDLDFVMAHKVLARPWYADALRHRHYSRIVILDNGMHEGVPVNNVEMVRAAVRCCANFVVPPDKLGNFDYNVAQLRELASMRGESSQWDLAPVVCGDTPAERKAFIQYCSDLGARCLCFPFREPRYDWIIELRHEIMAGLGSKWSRIHLLGVSELEELRRFVQLSNMGAWTQFKWSVDTAKAYKWGMGGIDMRTMTTWRNSHIGSEALLNLPTTHEDQLKPIIKNIHLLKAVCAGY